MAQKIEVLLISDLSGKSGDETVRFALDGKEYEIDLTESEATDLRDSLAPFIKAGRRVTGKASGAARSRRSAGGGPDPKAVREWAAANGIKVSDRGRVPADVIEQYLAAGNS